MALEIQITSEKDNELFGRKEVSGITLSEISPSRESVLKALSEKFSVPEDAIKIKGIHGSFGVKEFKIEANIYNSKQEKESIEIKKKKESEAEKKAAEKAAEEAKAAEESAKPKEEIKDEEAKSDQPEQEQAEEQAKEEEKKSEEAQDAQPDKEPTASQEPAEEKAEEAKE